jgi:hypothetical protein
MEVLIGILGSAIRQAVGELEAVLRSIGALRDPVKRHQRKVLKQVI